MALPPRPAILTITGIVQQRQAMCRQSYVGGIQEVRRRVPPASRPRSKIAPRMNSPLSAAQTVIRVGNETENHF